MSNRSVVERYARALTDRDIDTLVSLLHDEYVCRYPQSGELIRPGGYRAVIENYPGSEGAGVGPAFDRIVGSDDRFVSTPSFPSWSVVHLVGSGDDFTLAGTVAYPNGETWHVVALLTLRDGRIWRELDYFAEPFEPAEWRRPYVEREERPSTSARS